MAQTSLAIHIPPDSNPTNVSALILCLARDPDAVFGSVQELLSFMESEAIGSRTEIQSTAWKLGLLERSKEGIRISDDGFAWASTKSEVRGDLLHFLMYTRWREHDPLEFLPSWSYRRGCDAYWEKQAVELNDDFLDRQVEEIINGAESDFAAMGCNDFGGVSFSRKSLQGLHSWLAAVQPAVISDGQFSRRAFCPPELLLLAIGWVLRDEDAVTATDVLLSREKREAVCRVCLLEPNALDRTLDWMIPIFPKIIEPGTSAGYYGRFIRLHKLPTLADVVR